ncbi:tbc1 domain family member 2 (prostate antigen recognized and indentified by serex) (paris-1), partial [Brachionus plicatilis]
TDCKVLCMVFLEDFNMVLMGLISKELVAYDSQMKHYLWSIKLKEPILHMFSVKDGLQSYRLYCGLANGFLTYIELNSISQPCDIFDINVSNNPINYIEQIIDENQTSYLWLASVNAVYVLNERLLMNEFKFEVAENQYGPILMLKKCKYGVFLSIKDSSILHLYDVQTHSCKLLFDLRYNIKLNIETDDDFSYSKSRLTCYLSFEDLVLIGTGDGFLFIYSIERYEKKKVKKVHKKFSLITPMLRQNNSRRNLSIGPQLLGKILEKKLNKEKMKRNSSLPSLLNKLDETVGPILKRTRSFTLLDSSVSLKEIRDMNHVSPRMKKNNQKRYDFNMDLVTKVKISDQPVKCILGKKINNQDLVFTCSGSYGDDETVLKWTRNYENNWINEPFIEICPFTNVPKRPMYAKIEYFQNLKRKN